jgi:hypothetical protein
MRSLPDTAHPYIGARFKTVMDCKLNNANPDFSEPRFIKQLITSAGGRNGYPLSFTAAVQDARIFNRREC